LKTAKIRGKIAILAISITAFLILVGAIGIYELSEANSRMDAMYSGSLKSVEYLEEAKSDARTVLENINQLMLYSGDSEKQKTIQKDITDQAQAFNDVYGKYQAIGDFTNEEVDLQKQIDSNLKEYRDGREEVIKLALDGKQKDALNKFEPVNKSADAFLKNLEDLTIYNVNEADGIKKVNDDKFTQNSILMVVIIVFAILLAYWDTWFISGRIVKPLKTAIDHMGEVANYNLTRDVPAASMTRHDEIGDLARMVQKIEENLRSLIIAIDQTSEQLAASSEELTATSQQAASASNEVSKSIDEIANGATEQAENTMDGASKLIDLGGLIENNNLNINELTKSSGTVEEQVNEGLEIIRRLLKKTDECGASTKKVFGSIMKTDESSQKIGDASGLITSIAQQTNLLSLNASIEAARAGEHGKGFAVVADEIRNLAEQSAEATKIIDEMVHSLQADSKDAVDIMQGLKSILESQAQDVMLSESKYMEISGAMGQSMKAVGTIGDASVTMEQKKNDVENTVQSLSAIAEENAAGAQEGSASIEELTASMEDIANSSQNLSNLAQELRDLISQFQM
jgi:methyl-accepting chemotaxis protein